MGVIDLLLTVSLLEVASLQTLLPTVPRARSLFAVTT